MNKLFTDNIDIFICPLCNKSIEIDYDSFICVSCGRRLEFNDEILQSFYPHKHLDNKVDVTEIVKAFYEKTPFPNYQDLDSKEGLIRKAEKGLFANLLNQQIPYHTRILEVGCGTGQLSNYLGITAGRHIFGSDLCLNSLKLGQEFKIKNGIENTAFLQMNLFKPVFKPESFDVVICNGVLHHTGDPFEGFNSIAKLVKKDGIIVIGLYNTYGRISNDIRRIIFKITNNRFLTIDSHIRRDGLTNVRKHAWFMDQYKHPHESKHTIGEVLRWFRKAGFDFNSSIPKDIPLTSFSQNENLFARNSSGSKLDHFFVQLGMMLTPRNEGGFFTMIGQKR
jgi:2-polyprenyl-3-methyl-5-hydroxy-6-metoxy-1,4-benzoquinol methylase